MITLTVTVYNGIPPTGIQVLLDKVGGGYHDSFIEPLSFTRNFDLQQGNYLLTINGTNPHTEGRTKTELIGPFTEGPDPPSPQQQNTEQFTFNFFFSI